MSSMVKVKPKVWPIYLLQNVCLILSHINNRTLLYGWPSYNIFEFLINKKKLCKQLLRTLNISFNKFSYSSVIQDWCQLGVAMVTETSGWDKNCFFNSFNNELGENFSSVCNWVY